MDTWLQEFNVRANYFKDNGKNIVQQFQDLINKFFTGCDLVYKAVDDDVKALFVGKAGLTIFLQGINSRLVTVNINATEINNEKFGTKVTEFQNAVRKSEFYDIPKTPEYPSLPPLQRGRPFSRYDCCSNLLMERDIDEVVFDDVSPYQHVRILHSLQYGNILFLDDDLNLAESDLEYTRAITGFDLEDYSGKTVLILGGGDGGILHYLKDRGPKMITMIDIDQMVIDAAKVHLRGICHDALDSLSGSNYDIIVDDCVKYLEKYVSEKREFDYVINDLTAIPVSTEPIGSHWDFLRQILSLSMQVLKNDGKYFTQGNSQLRPEALAMYQRQLQKLECSVKFEKKVVCVPSYLENWIFYKIWKDV